MKLIRWFICQTLSTNNYKKCKMIKLVEYKYHLSRGTILRCKGQWPYETVVDFMVAEVIGEYRYQLWVVSGYKAGLTNVIFPPEATYETCAVNTNWLIDNWYKWGYKECPLEEVWVVENEELFPNREREEFIVE